MMLIRWLALAMMLTASPAFGHAFLERADPPVGSDVVTAPHTLTLRFTEAVEPLFSTVDIHDADGAAVAIGKPHTASGNDRELVVTLPEPHKDRYTVSWHLTSVDTHTAEGGFHFTLNK